MGPPCASTTCPDLDGPNTSASRTSAQGGVSEDGAFSKGVHDISRAMMAACRISWPRFAAAPSTISSSRRGSACSSAAIRSRSICRARFSEHITLKHPIVSANMDTITRAAMAVVQAEEGGLGVIDRGFRGGDIAAQVREVEIVKRTQHGVIPDPYTVEPTDSLAHARPHDAEVRRRHARGRRRRAQAERAADGARCAVRVRAEARERPHDAARQARRALRADLARTKPSR